MVGQVAADGKTSKLASGDRGVDQTDLLGVATELHNEERGVGERHAAGKHARHAREREHHEVATHKGQRAAKPSP